MLLVNTLSMHTGMRGTVIDARQAQRAVGAGRAQAVEPIHFVKARSSTHARV